jgi:mitogen-activated protein kinase kinase 1 interacting protein 1
MRSVTPAMDDVALHPAFTSTMSSSVHNTDAIGLGAQEYIITTFDNFHLLQWNWLPVIVTYVASTNANLGLMINSASDLQQRLLKLQVQ